MKKSAKTQAIKNIGKIPFFYPTFNDYRDDKEVVLAAIKQNGSDLIYASERLRDNKNIVIEALKNDKDKHYNVFRTVSLRLRDNPYVVLEAFYQNKHAIRYASNRIQELCTGNEIELALLGEIRAIEAAKLKNKLDKTISSDKSTNKKLKI